LNRVIPLLAFSILLLVPVGAQNAFATHPDELTCPDTGFGLGELITEATLFSFPPAPYCLFGISDSTNIPCVPPYFVNQILLTIRTLDVQFGCIAEPIPTPHITLAAQCEGASILVSNHCFAQALSNIIGGVLLDINTVSLLVGAIGTNPIITGLVAITIAGVAGQAVWFVHRRKKSENS